MSSVRGCLLIGICLVAGVALAGETIKCPCVADAWISSATTDEKAGNGGKADRIKLKFYQEFGLFDFNLATVKGKRIVAATLHLAPAGGEVFGKGRGTDLRWFTVSTMSSPWVEGEGTSYTKRDRGHGATFNEASDSQKPWAFEGSKVWDVTFGNGNSLRCDCDAGDPKDGYFTIPLDVRIVQAMASGMAYGVSVMDGNTGVERNCRVYSRESRQPPYLLVTVDGVDQQPPEPPGEINVVPAPQWAQTNFGAVEIGWKVPNGAFGYQIKVNGQPLPRWQIPFAPAVARYQHPYEVPKSLAVTSQKTQSTILDFLPSDEELVFEVATVDAVGNVSPFAKATGRTSLSAQKAVPNLPATTWKPTGGEAPMLGGKLKVWAYPEVCKLDPLRGTIALETGMENAERKNCVWDAATKTVRVVAARGEIASIQLALVRTGATINAMTVLPTGLNGIQTKLWRTWFVNSGKAWQAEYALPLEAAEPFAIPDATNQVPDQKAAAVTVDLIVPAHAPLGEQTGAIHISLGSQTLELKLQIEVMATEIPPEIHFNPELNAYSGFGTAGSAQWFACHRLAHFHRSSINRVTHSHQGSYSSDLSPTVNAAGHVVDWKTYDQNVGPLLDGSAFEKNPRANVPVPVLYLPLFEGYPLNFAKHYNPGVEAKGKDWKGPHDIFAKPVEQALPESYRQAFITCASDFTKHAMDKGWTRTRLQCFQNNKHQYGKDGWTGTAWMMDEPNEYLDWRAINYYAAAFLLGVEQAGGSTPPMCYRADVSRQMWQGNVSDGLMHDLYVGNDLLNTAYLTKATKRRGAMRIIRYGAANPPTQANHQTTAWCLQSYLFEADGVVPWQSWGSDEAFDKGDAPGNGNALIVDGRQRFNINAVASYRVHAFRAGAQLCELLRLLEEKKQWGRAHSAQLISQKISLGSQSKQTFTDDAAAEMFQGLNGDRFVELKEGLLRMLAE